MQKKKRTDGDTVFTVTKQDKTPAVQLLETKGHADMQFVQLIKKKAFCDKCTHLLMN